MPHIAFATSSEDPTLISDDRLCFGPLEARGITVEPLVWDGPRVELSRFDAIVIRSCWNYHRHHAAFLDWLQSLESAPCPVFNSPALGKWNVDKRYLLELGTKGVAVPETRVVSKRSDITAALAAMPSSRVVVKPVVSLNGEDTFLVEVSAAEATITKVLPRPVLVQEFLSNVSRGELSFIFMNGHFSHAVRKVAGPNEFRVHEQYGGTRERFDPSPHQLKTVTAMLGALPERDLLFTRVDVIDEPRGLVVMEIEVLDPMLYLHVDSAAPERFAAAIAERLVGAPVSGDSISSAAPA